MSKSAQAIADEVARECVMTRWRTTNRVLAAVYDEELRPFGLKSSQHSLLEHVPPQLNRGILVRRRMGESIGTDSLLGAGRCRGLIPGTCVSE
jgi:hypothetical protein